MKHNRNMALLIIPVVLLVCPAPDLFAGGGEMLRAWAGLELFPGIVAADTDIAEKTNDNGELRLLLVYIHEEPAVRDMAARLNASGSIRNIPVSAVSVEAARIDQYPDAAAVFMAEKMSGFLDGIIRFGARRHILVFSPFAGDVERGVPGGLIVSDRIIPYVNMDALSRFGITLNPFFLRIAESYEE